MNVQPIREKIAVRRVEPADDVSKGGIIIPEAAREKKPICEVVAVGDGYLNIENGENMPLAVSVGDRVLMRNISGVPIKVDGEDIYIVSENEVLAIIKEEAS